MILLINFSIYTFIIEILLIKLNNSKMVSTLFNLHSFAKKNKIFGLSNKPNTMEWNHR